MEAHTKSLTSVNVVAGLLTFYFVVTALLSVRRPAHDSPWIDRAAVLVALIVSVLAFRAGMDLMGSGRPEAGLAYPLVMFGIVALLGSAGDRRMMRAGTLRGASRLVRSGTVPVTEGQSL